MPPELNTQQPADGDELVDLTDMICPGSDDDADLSEIEQTPAPKPTAESTTPDSSNGSQSVSLPSPGRTVSEVTSQPESDLAAPSAALRSDPSIASKELTEEVFKEASKGSRNAGQTLKRLAEMGFSIGQTSDYLIAAVHRESSTVTSLKSFTHAQLKAKVTDAPGDLVEGLIPEHSVNIVVGDSGLGKTPLFVQLGLCVAAGIPFLGHPCRKGRVLYVDYKNGLAPFDRLLDTIVGHLGLEKTPDDFHHLHQPASIKEVYAEINAFGPDLVIIDAMRGFDPEMEETNSFAFTSSVWIRCRSFHWSPRCSLRQRRPGEGVSPR